MLGGLNRFRKRSAPPALVLDAGPRLFTIGYQGYSQQAYLKALISSSVTVLCDLRRTAISRDAAFGRLALSRACAEAGIRYEHLWQLGAHSEAQSGRGGRRHRDALLEDYRLRTLPNQQPLLEGINSWLQNGERVALMCFERHPEECHRSCVADQLRESFGEHCAPIHL